MRKISWHALRKLLTCIPRSDSLALLALINQRSFRRTQCQKAASLQNRPPGKSETNHLKELTSAREPKDVAAEPVLPITKFEAVGFRRAAPGRSVKHPFIH